jgi:hypothetical protein
MSLLSGFDLVYAVTQHTINKQLQLLSVESVLPTEWTYNDPGKQYSIDAGLGIPVVNMVTGDSSSRKVQISFPLTGGTFNYLTIGFDKNQNLAIVPKTTNVTGWQLILTINLSLAEITAQAISDHKKIPQAVKEQLSAFTDDMYDIRHLFLNFEDADLVDSYQLVAPHDRPNPDLNDPNVIGQVKNLIQALLNNLKGSDNPFIFGYAVNDKPANLSNDPKSQPPSSNADFKPTGTTYSVYPEPMNVDRSTINFLSVTKGREVPGAGYGIFTHNWVTANDVQGSFVIAQDLIMSKLLPALAKVMSANPSDFQSSGATLSLSNPNDVGGTISCTITPNAWSNSITAAFYSTFNREVYDRTGKDIGYVDGHLQWTTTIAFSFDRDDNLSVAVTNSPLLQQSQNHPNALGQFEQFLAVFADAILKAVSFGQAPSLFENLVNKDWSVNINADLSVIGSAIKNRLVLPAGSKFFFKDAIVSPEGHLIMTVTIKN